jgi:phage repressor protein C with HTH and peptisase S24 domain
MPKAKHPRPEYAVTAATIRRLRRAAGFATHKALADRLGLTPQAVQYWEAGYTSPRGTTLRNLAGLLGTTPGAILAGSTDAANESGIHRALAPGATINEWTRWEDLPEGEFVSVPRITVELAAGNGHLVDREVDEPPLAFRSDWLRKRKLSRENLRVVTVSGASMEPYLADGDVVMLNLAERTVADGEVYAMRYGDEVRVKRLYRRFDGGLIVRSDNRDAFPDEQLAAADLEHVEVIGKVVWRGG